VALLDLWLRLYRTILFFLTKGTETLIKGGIRPAYHQILRRACTISWKRRLLMEIIIVPLFIPLEQFIKLIAHCAVHNPCVS